MKLLGADANTPSAASVAPLRPARWVDATSCSGLCQLILDDRRGGCGGAGRRRLALPPALYAELVAPFLRFEAPLPDMLYAFGGRNRHHGPVKTAEMLDTWHGLWVRLPDMPRRRAGSAAASLPDGRLLVVGGYDERGIVDGLLGSCDVYCPVKEQWAADGVASLARARWGHGCATLQGKVYAVGGCALSVMAQGRPQEAMMETQRSCEVYDPVENSWSPCASLQVPRSGSRVVCLGSSHIAAVGGCDDVFGRAETQATIEIYSPVTRCWSLLDTRLAVPRTSAAVASIDGGRAFFVAGGAPSQASVEVYCVPAIANGRTVVDSSPTAAGQEATEPEPVAMEVDATEEAVADLKQEVENMPEGRMGCQAAVVRLAKWSSDADLQGHRNCVLVVGGELCDETGNGGRAPLPRVRQLSSVAAYDLDTSKWCEAGTVPAMTTARTTMALCIGSGRVAQARLQH